jgi:enoyl-CoA hydratase
MTLVELSKRSHVALVTLTAAETRNAISLAMVDEIIDVFDELEADEAIGAVVVTGAGDAFCAGADLATLAAGDPVQYARLYEGFLRVARCPMPTIAAVNGPAAGAGVNLALCCDLRLAGPGARFIARFLDLGLHPGGGHTWMLQRAVGRERALAMLVFGQEADAATAVQWGLALAAVDGDGLVEEAVALAARAGDLSRPLVERTLDSFDRVAGAERDEAIALEKEAQAWSVRQELFQKRVAALQRRISGAGGQGK